MTNNVKLTQERLKSLFDYNPLTGFFSRKTKDMAVVNPRPNANGYCRIFVDGNLYYTHRLAWLYVNGAFPPNQIDHINLIKTDNRIENLRLATQRENSQNLPKSKLNTSGVPGVCWDKKKKMWHARIRTDNGRISLGYYKEIAIASAAMAEGKSKHHRFNPQIPRSLKNE